VTVKADLIRQPTDFLCADAPRHLATRTTGTTGRPAEIWLSRYEMELWPAIGALAAVVRDDFRPTDTMQVNMSSVNGRVEPRRGRMPPHRPPGADSSASSHRTNPSTASPTAM